MTWKITFTPGAKRELKRLDQQVQRRVLRSMRAISELSDPRSRGKALSGNLSGFWSYRVGDYRVICELIDNQLVILVVDVGHRSAAYRAR